MGKPTFSEGQRHQLLRLVDEIRRCIDASCSINAGEAELARLAGQAEQLADELHRYSGDKALEHFNPDFGDDLNHVLPASPISGRYNPLAPPLEMTHEGDKAVGRVTFGKAYEGPPGDVHGAIVAAAYDQLLAAATVVNTMGGPTITLTVDYLKPTPLLKPLVFTAWVERTEGRKVFLRGECHLDDTLITRCNAVFYRL